MGKLFLALAIASLAAASAFSQSASSTFELDSGTSFSASTLRPGAPAITRVASPADEIISDMESAMKIIRDQHVGGDRLDKDALIKSSINTMLGELDPHSTFFDAAEFSEMLGHHQSAYSGTGSTISNFVRNGEIETYVIATHRGSSAAAANLRYGDRIISVDGVDIGGLTAEAVRDKVRGPRGTTVRLVVERASTRSVETIVLKRENIPQPSLPHYFMMRDRVGYVGLSDGFSNSTAAEMKQALRDLHRQGMNAMILDLRGNSGGILEQAVKVAEQFLPAGRTIISQRGRSSFKHRKWGSANGDHESRPLVVLVDEQTASAAEVVAGALQDNDRALIVGRTTFGKGLVQNVIELPMGSGLTLTSARYYSPSGRSIQRSYAGSGKYDYYNHRGNSSATQTAAANRTLTNRPVTVGSGIVPDEVTRAETFNSKKSRLVDPIFFFVRENAIPSSDPVRGFREFLSKAGWKIASETVDAESAFIAEQLRYHAALSASGVDAATRSRIESDTAVAAAIAALPRAAILSAKADRAVPAAGNKNTRRVAFPTGQGRNRRN